MVDISTEDKVAFDAEARRALHELWDSTNGIQWHRQDNWLTPDVCLWYGVTCTACNTSIAKLELPDNNLWGRLPDLGAMPALTHLNLQGNALQGPVPDVRNMPKLSSLLLGGNAELEGEVPDSWHLCIKMDPGTFLTCVVCYVTLCLLVLVWALLLP